MEQMDDKENSGKNGQRDTGLERLCRAYLDLNDGDREKVIRLGEGLLSSQKVIDGENYYRKENLKTGDNSVI